ncbi:MAG: DMT family transporter [Aquisalimonadaceae bacterium]
MSVPAAYLGVIIVWATTPLAIQWSGESVGFLFGATSRMALGAGLSLLLVLAFRAPMPWHRRAVQAYASAAIGVFGAMLTAYWAAQHVPSGLISVLFGLTPLIAGVLAALWLNERNLTAIKITGILLGIAGLAVIFRADLSDYPTAWKGITALLVAASLHSVSMVLVKRHGESIPALAQSTGGLLLALPCYLLLWLLVDGGAWPEHIPLRSGLAILYLGGFGSVLGFLLYFHVLKRLTTGSVALITLITPVLALLLGRFVNQEQVPASVWAGSGLVLAGLALHQWGHRLGRQRYKSVAEKG